ncbi:oxidoreductase [Dasania sp. GY-MA-18]|uniref:Oxidoreductase n=1 Tax=Dasania phycosphaerae TaxID=2950436 RepID=A0A9J6RMM5_9GAMM|nr:MULTISPECIES: MDR family oxidoreductase [Dasania]MCR8922807.1 oxidoreductase [Dasania sp. GY-MA-18]MCZ0865237.1 oxidoreductase [Dasania phycosphaerae]MCZ0868963.1 oxidoreductase [Dasania phycosphaerae]
MTEALNTPFNAIVAEDVDGKPRAALKSISLNDLPDEEVLVEVAYSTLNYKDGLAVSGKGRICRSLPLICGIDLAGTVLESKNPAFTAGDKVLVNGYGLSEIHNGGYSQYQRLKAEWLVRAPAAFSLEHCMALGTAGYTAMLCVQAIQDHGIKPEDGPVLVTGAAGGVGSVAISLLSKLGYSVTAVTGRVADSSAFLRDLGASDIISRDEFIRDCKPLERETWAAAVDTVGDKLLATVLSQIKYEGLVAACGLAGGINLPSTVMPFILRGVTLRGIDSVMASQPRRQRAWDALAQLTDIAALEKIYRIEPMSKLPELAQQIIAGKIQGRVVIDVNQ